MHSKLRLAKKLDADRVQKVASKTMVGFGFPKDEMNSS